MQWEHAAGERRLRHPAQRADPVIGLTTTVAIVAVLVASARQVLGRMLDGVDPADLATARATLAATPGVLGVEAVRLRWVGGAPAEAAHALARHHREPYG